MIDGARAASRMARMKKARGVWLGLAAGVAIATSAAFVACSSSSDNNGSPLGVDASEEASADSGTPDSTVSEPDSDGTHPGMTDAVADVAAASPEASVAAGFHAVWTVYRCAGCHQKASQLIDDAGNGIVLSGNNNGIGDSGMTFPPNLTNDPSTGLGCYSDEQIRNAILTGSDPTGGSLCPSMPRWGNNLGRVGTPMDAGTAQEIVDFLRSLAPVVNEVTDTTCPSGDAGSPDAGDAGH
jgi:hypothetical protein